MNALEQFRIDRRLSFQALATLIGVDKGRAFQWCTGARPLPAARVLDIEAVTGIPRVQLRPDVFGERPGLKPLVASKAAPC